MQKRKGFTLIELMVVVLIIAVLSTLSVLWLRNTQAQSKLSVVTNELAMLTNAVTQFAEDNFYQYPADVSRGMPPGLERYVTGGVWPEGPWEHGVYDWDNWTAADGQRIYQVTYRLCESSDPVEYCSDPTLFPNFGRNSSIFSCISGPCVPHIDSPTVPGYCVNCSDKTVNY